MERTKHIVPELVFNSMKYEYCIVSDCYLLVLKKKIPNKVHVHCRRNMQKLLVSLVSLNK